MTNPTDIISDPKIVYRMLIECLDGEVKCNHQTVTEALAALLGRSLSLECPTPDRIREINDLIDKFFNLPIEGSPPCH